MLGRGERRGCGGRVQLSEVRWLLGSCQRAPASLRLRSLLANTAPTIPASSVPVFHFPKLRRGRIRPAVRIASSFFITVTIPTCRRYEFCGPPKPNFMPDAFRRVRNQKPRRLPFGGPHPGATGLGGIGNRTPLRTIVGRRSFSAGNGKGGQGIADLRRVLKPHLQPQRHKRALPLPLLTPTPACDPASTLTYSQLVQLRFTP
ncbi:hypothetical protein BDK51DRAFT_46161 [Blyttiomyces helicus]|uniref:Uncharacterized protein n=1 Tax=Blyttiomyces helicus TaxID=388810 RepID=A0A4P9W321_9FUNG|nr:hypothetical protein BDK51DRAFT_46161 [Blyttiomyces helicus]|eukprot:RKO86671.1 hypothetical protein BDK51DRAFT_46161 [Blyttiomyces helicus]